MAWKARLADTVTCNGADSVVAVFEFYDDQVLDPESGQPRVQGREAFSFPPHWSNADMQQAVIARGIALKAAKLRADALAAQFPPTTTVIAIP